MSSPARVRQQIISGEDYTESRTLTFSPTFKLMIPIEFFNNAFELEMKRKKS